MDPGQIRYVYFGTLAVLSAFSLVMLSLNEPTRLLLLAGMVYNYAFGFSCFHTVFVNSLPAAQGAAAQLADPHRDGRLRHVFLRGGHDGDAARSGRNLIGAFGEPSA